MRRLQHVSIVLTLAIVLSAQNSNAGGIVGDVNGDDQVNLEEAIFALQVTSGQVPPPGSSIVGSWWSGETPQANSFFVLTFLNDSSFFFCQYGDSDAVGNSGTELGTYSWNESTGVFEPSITVDTNGEWGFSHPVETYYISVIGNTLTFTEGSDSFEMTRVTP